MKAGYFGAAVVFACMAILVPCSHAMAATEEQGHGFLLQGKVQCFMKREVVIPFKGIIAGVAVQPGQSVKAGDVLATYVLAPETGLQLRKQIDAPQIMDMELSVLNGNNTLFAQEKSRLELVRLTKENMAPAQSLTQIETQIRYSKKSLETGRKRVQTERDEQKDFDAYLKQQLGGSFDPVLHPLEPASIRSPISGRVIEIQSDLSAGAELGQGAPVFLIGVTDPMVIRAQIFESDLPKVALGDKAEVILESIPNRTFEARVSRMSFTPLVLGLQQPSYYDIELTIRNPDDMIKEGFKGRVLFHPPPGAK